MLPALILGAVLIGGCVSAPTNPETQRWSCRSEIYDLAVVDGRLIANTSGGIFAIVNGVVTPYPAMPARPDNHPVSAPGDGAFLSATTTYKGQLIATYWSGKSIFAVKDDSLEPFFPRPPAEGDYALAAIGEKLYAGTNRGLFVREENDWREIELGGELPFSRVHGVGKIAGEYVLGGIDGVAIGSPGNWKTISRESVRQVLQSSKDVWIVYGSGAVDKLTADGRLHSDVLFGTAKRPWTSAAAVSEDGLLFGGMGGWIKKGKLFSEEYPPEFKDQVVTAIAAHGGRLFVGTQEKGISVVSGKEQRWINPATGLADTWVTALLSHGKTLYAATATAGLYEIRGSKAIKIATPSEKLRHLAIHEGALIIGALDGAWRKSKSTWHKLETDSQETTFLSTIEKKLWIGTPSGLYVIGS